MDELLSGRIYFVILIPPLSQLNKPTSLRTIVGPTLSLSLFVEIGKDYNPPTEHDHAMYLYRALESN